MNILNLNLVDNETDQKVIELLSKSMPQEDLEKALNRSGLVQRIIQVKTKHGIVNRKQWVRASELKQPEKPRKKTAVEIEELAIEGAKLPKIYGKTIRDLTPQQIEDLNNIAVPRARMTALKNLIGEEGSIKWALELGLKWKRYPDDLEKDWANAHRAIKRYFIAGNKIHVPDGNTKVEPKKATDTKSYEDLKTLLNDLENKYNNSMIDVTINDNLPNHTVKATKITHETEKAVSIDISIADHGGYKERVFLPKSQVKIVGDQVVGVKGWVIAKKNLQSLLISGNGKHNLFKYDVKVLDDVNDTKRVEPKAEPKTTKYTNIDAISFNSNETFDDIKAKFNEFILKQEKEQKGPDTTSSAELDKWRKTVGNADGYKARCENFNKSLENFKEKVLTLGRVTEVKSIPNSGKDDSWYAYNHFNRNSNGWGTPAKIASQAGANWSVIVGKDTAYIKQPIKDESGAIVDTKIYKVAIGNVTPTATQEPEKTEPKTDTTQNDIVGREQWRRDLQKEKDTEALKDPFKRASVIRDYSFFGEGNKIMFTNKFYTYEPILNDDEIIINTNYVKTIKGSPVLVVDNNKVVYIPSRNVRKVHTWNGRQKGGENSYLVKVNKKYFKTYTLKEAFHDVMLDKPFTFESLKDLAEEQKGLKVANGHMSAEIEPTATKEPENTEPKVDDTKKEEPKKDPNVKPQPYGKIYKSVADFPKDTIIIRDRKSFIEKFRGKTLTLVGECKDLFHVRLFQDEQGNNYRVDNLEYMIKFFKFTSPKVLTHTEDRDGKLYDVTTYTFDDGVKLKNPTDDLRDFEKVDSSVLEPNRSMAGVKADKPMRFERANSRSVNPHRYDNTSDKEKKGYMNNCQTCVVAFEARLRGYNVEAKPKSKPTNKTDASMYAYNTMVDLSYDTTLAWDKEQRLDIVKYEKGRTNAYNWMNRTIKKGERYHLYYYHKGLSGGHIVTAFKDDDGEPVIYDPQSGESTKGKADIIDYFAYKTTHATMYRVDNLKFNFDVMNKIVKESK